MEGKKLKILIVEDDLITRRVLNQILSQIGECDTVTNGNEAVRSFRRVLKKQDPYDLICMDIMIPEMDGHQAIQKIRDIERDHGIKGSDEVNVIVISALDDPKNVIKAFKKGGASSYLVKPVIREKLYSEIRNMGFIIDSNVDGRRKSISI